MGLQVKMPDGEIQVFTQIAAPLDTALRQGGRPGQYDSAGNTLYQHSISRSGNGWLLDNCPLNIALGMGWLPGQIEAMREQGLVPRCPECGPGTRCFEEFATAVAEPAPAAPGPTTQGERLPPPPGGYPPGSVSPYSDGSCGDGYDLMSGGGFDAHCAPAGSAPAFRSGTAERETVQRGTDAGNTAPQVTPQMVSPSYSPGAPMSFSPTTTVSVAPGGGGEEGVAPIDYIEYLPLILAGVAIMFGYKRR